MPARATSAQRWRASNVKSASDRGQLAGEAWAAMREARRPGCVSAAGRPGRRIVRPSRNPLHEPRFARPKFAAPVEQRDVRYRRNTRNLTASRLSSSKTGVPDPRNRLDSTASRRALIRSCRPTERRQQWSSPRSTPVKRVFLQIETWSLGRFSTLPNHLVQRDLRQACFSAIPGEPVCSCSFALSAARAMPAPRRFVVRRDCLWSCLTA